MTDEGHYSEGTRSPYDLLTLVEAAKQYRLGQKRLRSLLADGSIGHIIIGVRTIRIPRRCIEQWIDESIAANMKPPTSS